MPKFVREECKYEKIHISMHLPHCEIHFTSLYDKANFLNAKSSCKKYLFSFTSLKERRA